jgi:hypothetical protein
MRWLLPGRAWPPARTRIWLVGHPLVDEVARKAAIAWLDGRAAWCAWLDDALYVVSGPGEQELGELATGVTVTLRGDHGGRVVSWPAQVVRLVPGSAEWDRIAPQLAGKRLNASGGAEEVVARWAARCALYALRPGAGPVVAGADLPATSLAEPPRPTPAARPAKRPFKLHRVRRR